jgi:hypothetical protein
MSCVLLAYLLLSANSELSGNRLAATVGRGVWLWGALAQAMLLPLMAPAFTCGAITLEREREMLELLLLTRQSAFQICVGKLFSGLGLALTLLLVSVPTLAISLVLGGVSPGEIFATVCVLATAVTATSALGLAASSFMPRTVSATVLSYLIVGGGMIGFPLMMSMLRGASMSGEDGSVSLIVMLPMLMLLAFPPAVAVAYGLYAHRRRRGASDPQRVWWMATIGFTWCFLLLTLYLPGMIELLLHGKALLYLHPTIVVSVIGTTRSELSSVASDGWLPSPDIFSFGSATAPFSSSLGIGTELWWCASLCYLGAAVWLFYLALLRVRRLRIG